MLKQIFISGTLLISSMSAYADIVAPTLYQIDMKEKINDNSFSVTTKMGSILPIESRTIPSENEKSRPPLKSEKCLIQINDGITKTDFETSQIQSSDKNAINASVYPVSIDGDKVKFVLVYSKQDMMVSSEAADSIQIGDDCNFHNSVVHSVSTDVKWAGYLTLGKTTTIPVSSNNSIDLTITEVKSSQ